MSELIDPAGKNETQTAGSAAGGAGNPSAVDIKEKHKKVRDSQIITYSEIKKGKDLKKAQRAQKILADDQDRCRKLLEEWERDSKKTIKKLDKDIENLDAEIEKEIASREDYPDRYTAAMENVKKAEKALQTARAELNEIKSENSNSQSRESEKRREKVHLENAIHDMIEGVRRGSERIFPALPVDVRCPVRGCNTSLPSKAIYPYRDDFPGIEIGACLLLPCPGPVCRNIVRVNRVTGDVRITRDEADLELFGI